MDILDDISKCIIEASTTLSCDKLNALKVRQWELKSLKKIRYCKERNLVLFYAREEARVWAY